jgi:hypothetical protein
MRMGNQGAGFVGALALVSSACFYGPDWPPSIDRGSTVSPGGSGTQSVKEAGADAGTDADAQVVGDSGVTSFACIPQTTSSSAGCIYYKNVPEGALAGLQMNCANLQTTCSLPTVACCVTNLSGSYTTESCYYAPSTLATVTATCAAGTVQTSP